MVRFAKGGQRALRLDDRFVIGGLTNGGREKEELAPAAATAGEGRFALLRVWEVVGGDGDAKGRFLMEPIMSLGLLEEALHFLVAEVDVIGVCCLHASSCFNGDGDCDWSNINSDNRRPTTPGVTGQSTLARIFEGLGTSLSTI
jgi:hypothetical protein